VRTRAPAHLYTAYNGSVQPSEVHYAPDRRFVFDEVAELYARARPTYPAALIEDVIRGANLRQGSRILELGCGPGNATVLFSGCGFRLVCLEPGERLAEVTRRRVAANNDTEVIVTTFENWPIGSERFALVFAAQSFHWMDPQTRFSKAAAALDADGMLAVFANRALRGNSALDQSIQQVYELHAPHLRIDSRNTRDHFLDLFAGASEFRMAECREYPWHAEYSADEYVGLVQTHSDHRIMPEAQRRVVLDGIQAAIEASGGTYPVDYLAVLCLAHRV
jgi:SAM-dependent methyltransferase